MAENEEKTGLESAPKDEGLALMPSHDEVMSMLDQEKKGTLKEEVDEAAKEAEEVFEATNRGEETSTEWIPAANFSASWGVRTCDYGQWLINETNLQVLANATAGYGIINPTNPTTPQGTSVNNATIYICLEHVGSAEQISGQSYSTSDAVTVIEDWLITSGTAEI